MTDLLTYGMPEERAERHRSALRDLRKELESYDMRCRPVERLHLPMRGWYYQPILLPPEMDVYDCGCLLATVTVVDVPGRGGAWFLIKQPDGVPTEAKTVTDPATAARAVAARREKARPEQAEKTIRPTPPK